MLITLFILPLLLLRLEPIKADRKINKYVTTLINAKWNDTPLVLEVAEYLNDENVNYFWRFIDAVAENENGLQNAVTEKDLYEAAILLAAQFLSSAEMAVLKLGLSLRIYSARVEMFHQMAENKNDLNLNCDAFVDVGGKLSCSLENLEELIQKDEWEHIDTYSVDHFYSGKQNTNKCIVLYGQLGTENFARFHKALKFIADEQKINYVVRHYVKNRPNRKLRLSGYGVELQMKSTEYKATDDSDIKENRKEESEEGNKGVEELDGINFSILKKLYADKQEELEKLQNHLLDTSHEIGALKVWQFQDLSHQAAERIMNSPSSEAIKILLDIAQNFPMQAKSLIKTKVNADMKMEMNLNQQNFSATLNIQPTDTAIFINGLFFDLETIDILTLLECLRAELRVMEPLYRIGFSNKKIQKLLYLDSSTDADNQDFAIDIRDSAIIWVNDIEKDSQYRRWPEFLTELLRPTFPGMLRSIRRNLYNLVLIIDPLNSDSMALFSLVESLYAHYTPLRIGFVFVINYNTSITGLQDPSIAVNNAFHYFVESQKKPKEALYFLSNLRSFIGPDGATVDDIKKAIKDRDPKADVNYILSEESEYDVGRHLACDFVKRTGFKTFPQALLNGVPLSSSQLHSDSFEDAVLSTVMTQTPSIQKAIYKREVTDRDDIVEYLMNLPNVMPRLNERVLKMDKDMWLQLNGNVPKDKEFTKWSKEDSSAWVMENSRYLYVSRKSATRHLYSLWIVLDLEEADSRKLLAETLEYLEGNAYARASIIVNSAREDLSKSSINAIAVAAMNVLPPEKAINYLRNLIKDEVVTQIEKNNYEIEDESILNRLSDMELLWGINNVHNHYARNVLRFSPSQRAVICNGRLIGPFDENEEFTTEDFSLLERYSQNTYGDKLFNILMKTNFLEEDDDDYGKNEVTDDVIMKISSLLVSRPQTRSRYDVLFNGDEHSAIKILAPIADEVAFNIVGIVDPVSRGAQKLGPILDILKKSLNCNIKVFLNCLDKNSDMPLKSFYRFVLEPEIQFGADGEMKGAVATFTKLPTSSLLTQHIHAPENWLVEVVRSVYDLDNIKLDNVAMGVHSEFELEHLLLEGHCFEATVGNTPRGLQINLGTERIPAMVDTIVMANLGYFQLKANPGEWRLRLRQGRSSDIYDIVTVDGQDIIHKENEVKVLLSSLRSHVLKLKVSKKPDKAKMDLLSDDDNNSGIWNSISRTFTNEESEEQDEKINIFSLASGHLYERFLKIMMLSVIKHTKTPVKFWFLKNYLSPTLKDFLPEMSKTYGFEYELVQYKWPRWLHQQTEKQRTIWGYKILFLDVLFPLDVKKIIFVDADQVVRADLKELVNIDLGGSPYAYTPFCDSRKEMEGFRFWKHGYWRTHLQGRSYHISALYVVDLKRFRRIAAGDRLRGQYQALSQDPNSLSNLDQDLPNNMIHQVSIKSLPQEWLWCETWCDDSSKKHAKTIDLCNNPMTKEAKLQAAMRILPEWVGYDDEIKALQQKIENAAVESESEQDELPDTFTSHEEL